MSDKDMVFRLRKRIIEDWRWKRLTWQEVKEKYGISKRTFYRYRERFLKNGYEGLKNKVPKPPVPRVIGYELKIRILDYIYENPTHGPDRIAREHIPRLCTKTVWSFLKRENLNSRRKRRLWAEFQGKRVLTHKERCCLQAKDRHIESYKPGELISIDSLTVSVKGLGKIWHYTACDTYSSYGWIKAYRYKTSDNAVDFFINHMAKIGDS